MAEQNTTSYYELLVQNAQKGDLATSEMYSTKNA